MWVNAATARRCERGHAYANVMHVVLSLLVVALVSVVVIMTIYFKKLMLGWLLHVARMAITVVREAPRIVEQE